MASITVLSTADYAADVWTNKQHLASRLAKHTDVNYIESMGLRSPTFARADLQRVADRLRPTGKNQRNHSTVEAPPSLNVLKPRVVPFHSHKAARLFNGLSLRAQLQTASGATTALWTFSPLTYNLEAQHGVSIYHSVDLLHELPGVPAEPMLAAEKRLMERVDVVIASSAGVQKHLYSQGARNVLLWENVADVERYHRADEQRAPRAVFAGNLTGSKVDFDLLLEVASLGIEVVLAGPREIDGTSGGGALDALLRARNVRYVGNIGRDDLADLLNTATVGLVPYHLNRYTQGVFPMKIYEYLAAGLEVVTTPLASLVGRDAIPFVHVRKGSDFAEATRGRIELERRKIDDVRAVADGKSWGAREQQAVALLTSLGYEFQARRV